MNYTEIKIKYPTAWGIYMEWCYTKHNLLSHVDRLRFEEYLHLSKYLERQMYDFFDEQGLIISPCFQIDIEKSYWQYEIMIKKGVESAYPYVMYEDNNFFEPEPKDRKEAETLAFTKAFELLEQQL